MMDALHVGPILLGAAKPAHILTPSVTSRGVVNMTALAVVEAQAKVSAAINNYCNAQIRLAVQKKREIWQEGRKSLRIGLVFWAICLALSLLFEEVIFTRHAFGRLFGEGFIIAGWVGLWRPAELLLYDWRPYSREKKRYEEIKTMDVRIVPRMAGETQPSVPV
jgi:hypothetical protein